MSSVNWPSDRVTVTGGAGFLGSYVVEALRARGAREIFVPRSKEFELVNTEDRRVVVLGTGNARVLHVRNAAEAVVAALREGKAAKLLPFSSRDRGLGSTKG